MLIRNSKQSSTLLLSLALGMLISATSNADTIGQVKRLQGSAQAIAWNGDHGRSPANITLIRRLKGLPVKKIRAFGPTPKPRKLSLRSNLFFLDQLRTQAKARLQAILDDGTDITLGENAELVINEFVYDPRQGLSRLTLDFVNGAFVYSSGKIATLNKGKITINTPVASIGIRGTKFWGGNIDGGFGILVLEGAVVVNTTSGQVTLPAGSGTMIRAQNKYRPQAPRRWPAEKIARAIATVSFDRN